VFPSALLPHTRDLAAVVANQVAEILRGAELLQPTSEERAVVARFSEDFGDLSEEGAFALAAEEVEER